MQSEKVTHPWEPVYNPESRVLILGSIPSPKSREVGFYKMERSMPSYRSQTTPREDLF
jgi:hypothetical protein